MNNQVTFDRHFCGNEISEYGRQHGFVDYATLAKAFDAVLNNNIIQVTGWENWEQENGLSEYYEDSHGNILDYDEMQERVEEMEKQLEQLEEGTPDYYELEEAIADLEEANYSEIYQYYIISDNGAEILKDYTNEIVMYNAELDMYVWCVTHWGTSWDYVLTDIPCTKAE